MRDLIWKAVNNALRPVTLLFYGLSKSAYQSARTREDYPFALFILKAGAVLGSLQSQYHLAWNLWHGIGTEPDHELAVKWYRRAADRGLAKAQAQLGYAYDTGKGVVKDYEEAFRWYSKAAEQDHAWAQYCIGLMYHHGKGVEKSPADSAIWMGRAAENGSGEAQLSLGYSYWHGRGVAQNREYAVHWYRKAAEQNLTDAYICLAQALFDTSDKDEDLAEAEAALLKASENGDARAQCSLGVRYYKGSFLQQDRIKGLAWLMIAGGRSHVDASEHLETAEAAASPSEIEQARSLADDILDRVGKPKGLSREALLTAKEW